MKKIAVGLLGALATAIFAVGTISPSYAQDPAPTNTPAPSPTPALSDLGTGNIVIRFWNGLSGSDGVTLNAMTEQFAAANPDYRVQTEIMTWDVMNQRLQAALVAGDAPDLVVFHTSELPQYIEFGGFQPVDFLYGTGENQIDPADFSPTALQAVTVDGVVYGVPLDNHGWGFWTNDALFEAAGLEVELPQNYDEFVELAKQLTLDANGNNPGDEGFDAANIQQYGTAVSWELTTFRTLLYQNGGSLFSEDGSTATVNSDAAKRTLQQMYDLIYVHNVAPVVPFDNWQAFAGGRIAMLPEGSWFRNFLVLDNPDIQWTAHPFPQLGDQPATWMSAHVFYIPTTTTGDKLAAVQTYIKWMSDNNGLWAESGQIPARLSQQEELDPETYPSNIVFAGAFNEFGVFDRYTTATPEIESALNAEIIAVLTNQKTVEQGLNDANARIQTILDR
jgi:ABC-type glycerol-3-phosphate transport system substrate-binding protein